MSGIGRSTRKLDTKELQFWDISSNCRWYKLLELDMASWTLWSTIANSRKSCDTYVYRVPCPLLQQGFLGLSPLDLPYYFCRICR